MTSLLVPLLALAATYALLSPWLYTQNGIFAERLPLGEQWRQREQKPTMAQAAFLASLVGAVVASALISFTLMTNSYASFVDLITFGLAALGVYMITGNAWLGLAMVPVAAVGAALLPGSRGVLTLLAVIGAYSILSHTFIGKHTKLFLAALIITDFTLVSSGLLLRIFPFFVSLPDHALLVSFSFPNGISVGVGDFLALLLFSHVTLSERPPQGAEISPRFLAGVIYLLGMSICIFLVASGSFMILPATLPIAPALLVHELYRWRLRARAGEEALTTPAPARATA